MTHVIDASALLAVILGERGGDKVVMPGRCLHISMVNLAEVYTKVVENGGSVADVQAYVASIPLRVRAFRERHAIDIAELRPLTKHRGLSFGDRACLALAMTADLPVLTADTKWADLDLGIDIQLIREPRP